MVNVESERLEALELTAITVALFAARSRSPRPGGGVV
jgi:hypothetical protein